MVNSSWDMRHFEWGLNILEQVHSFFQAVIKREWVNRITGEPTHNDIDTTSEDQHTGTVKTEADSKVAKRKAKQQKNV